MLSVPFLSYAELQKRTEAFRTKFIGNDNIPVDIELIVEKKVGLVIVPTAGLIKDSGLDALYFHTLDEIWVDNDEFYDEQSWNRLRFSLAHELGHYWLHKQLLSNQNFNSIDDWKKEIQNMASYDRMEIQAKEFAGRLVVPLDRLIGAIKEHRPRALEYAIEREDLKERLSERISRLFRVSPEVIETRFDRENLNFLING